METILRNTGNSKTNEPHNFILNLPQRLDLRSLNKLYIYYMWKNIRQQYKDMDFCHSREIYLANMENDYWILLQKHN